MADTEVHEHQRHQDAAEAAARELEEIDGQSEGGEAEAPKDEETKAEEKPKAGKQKPPLPAGVVSPIAALNHLKQKNLIEDDYKPQQMYGFVKNPGKTDPFPVLHYDATGTAHKEAQVNEHGITVTRPGVKHEEVVAWWGRKGQRDEQKAKEKKEKAEKKAAAEAAKATGATAEGEGVTASEGAEEFEQVEGLEEVE